MNRPIRTMLFSTLYPSSARPGHGIFVETRLRELLIAGQVQSRVVAPVPWFPSLNSRHGERARMAATPSRETWHGIEVRHPRYLVLPKVGMTIAPFLLALGARRAVQALIDDGFDFDLIDAHYYYPDGVAAALLARWFCKPLVITARGSDVNLIGQYRLPRGLMRWASGQAAATVAVSCALADRLVEIGAVSARQRVLRNGVDVLTFNPEPQAVARQHLGVDGAPLLLAVGNLLPAKRMDWAIHALALLRRRHPNARLAVVGDGPERTQLAAQIESLGLSNAAHLVGAIPQSELPAWYSAADLLVLASSREGWPNVVLEAMACGTPVVASRVGGVSEVITSDVLGLAVSMEEPSDLAAAIERVLDARLDRSRIRQYATGMGWAEVSQGQADLFADILANAAGAGPANRDIERA